MKVFFQIAECSFSYLKKMQTSAMKVTFKLPSAAFSYLKIMQTSAMKTCFQIAECRLNFCKGRKNLGIMQVHFGSFVCFPYFLCYNSALCS